MDCRVEPGNDDLERSQLKTVGMTKRPARHASSVGRIFCGKSVSTFPKNALTANLPRPEIGPLLDQATIGTPAGPMRAAGIRRECAGIALLPRTSRIASIAAG